MAIDRQRDSRRHLQERSGQAGSLHPGLRQSSARRLGAADATGPLPPPTDERIKKTVYAIADELTVDGLVRRYRVDQTDDGLRGVEGTFAICSFWLVSALSEIGERQRARHLCEKMLSFASPLGLYAEEIDARSGRHLGNFPQAFTHLALINAVVHVIEAEQEDAIPSSPRLPGITGA